VTPYEELDARLRAFSRAPYLFVGAGMSRRFLGADGWVDLLQRMAAHTDRPYAYFASKADGDLPQVATQIAQAFHEVWWSSPEFEESRQLHGDGLRTREGPLKVEIARHTESALESIPTSGSLANELQMLGQAVIDGAITTNYDGLLQHLFPEFKIYVGQDELLFSDAQGIGEIYMIHGSAAEPESIVVTASDYDEFGARNPYLAAKLMTVFVEHPVIFLGYSLSDPDVTAVLVSVARVLTTENLTRLRDRLIFVRWDETQPASLVPTQIAVSGFNIPVILVTVPDFQELFAVLTRLPRKFSARLLRRLREYVYELVMSSDPNGRITVIDIDDSTHLDDVDVVLGVGVKERLGERGYVGLTRADLLKDTLRQVTAYDPRKVVEEALPGIMRQPGNVPVYRYLRQAGFLLDDGTIENESSVDAKVAQRASRGAAPYGAPAQSRGRGNRLVAASGGTLEGLIAESPIQDVLLALSLVSRGDMELETLRKYLVEHEDAFHTAALSSVWAKAVCLYDYYRFGAIDPTTK
jgi:hypothetical protein